MLPLGKPSNARLILVNRRDYIGAIPFNSQERADLFTAAAVAKTEPDEARTRILVWMRDRAREVYDLLVHIVAEHKIPLARPGTNRGGIVAVGWSFGTTLMAALLTNMASFPVGNIDLRKYLRRVVVLGAYVRQAHMLCCLSLCLSHTCIQILPISCSGSPSCPPCRSRTYFRRGSSGSLTSPSSSAGTSSTVTSTIPTHTKLAPSH